MQEDHLLHGNVTLERIILCKLTFNQELKKNLKEISLLGVSGFPGSESVSE